MQEISSHDFFELCNTQLLPELIIKDIYMKYLFSRSKYFLIPRAERSRETLEVELCLRHQGQNSLSSPDDSGLRGGSPHLGDKSHLHYLAYHRFSPASVSNSQYESSVSFPLISILWRIDGMDTFFIQSPTCERSASYCNNQLATQWQPQKPNVTCKTSDS